MVHADRADRLAPDPVPPGRQGAPGQGGQPVHDDRAGHHGVHGDRGRDAAERRRLLAARDGNRDRDRVRRLLVYLVSHAAGPAAHARRAPAPAGTSGRTARAGRHPRGRALLYAAARRRLIRTASIRFWRTDSTRIEYPLAAIVSPRLGSRPSSANTNPPT